MLIWVAPVAGAEGKSPDIVAACAKKRSEREREKVEGDSEDSRVGWSWPTCLQALSRVGWLVVIEAGKWSSSSMCTRWISLSLASARTRLNVHHAIEQSIQSVQPFNQRKQEYLGMRYHRVSARCRSEARLLLVVPNGSIIPPKQQTATAEWSRSNIVSCISRCYLSLWHRLLPFTNTYDGGTSTALKETSKLDIESTSMERSIWRGVGEEKKNNESNERTDLCMYLFKSTVDSLEQTVSPGLFCLLSFLLNEDSWLHRMTDWLDWEKPILIACPKIRDV
jgi:hypothetical protein